MEWVLAYAMTDEQKGFLDSCSLSARMVAHPFPDMAASEAALESGYGRSLLARQGNNLFGMKQHQHAIYGTLTLPTREFTGSGWIMVQAPFVKYPTLEDCFADRLNTLTRLKSIYPDYKLALEAQSPEEYVTHVSRTWSTDPSRAKKCILIWREYTKDFEQPA